MEPGGRGLRSFSKSLELKGRNLQAAGREGFGEHRDTGLLEFPTSSCWIREPMKDPRPQNLWHTGPRCFQVRRTSVLSVAFSGPTYLGTAAGPALASMHPSPGSWGKGVLTTSSHLGTLGLVVPGFVDTGSWEPPNCDVRSGPQPLPRRRWWPPRALLMQRTPRPGSSVEIGEQPRYLEIGGRGRGSPWARQSTPCSRVGCL